MRVQCWSKDFFFNMQTLLLSCLEKNQWKSRDSVFTVALPTSFPFYKSILPVLACWELAYDSTMESWVAIFLLIQNKHIFPGENVSGPHLMACTREVSWGLQGCWARVWYSRLPHCHSLLSCQSWALKVLLSPGSGLMLSLHFYLSRLYLGSV